MNLFELRQQFVVRSGRYDLVGEGGENAGADFFIQAGQRFLDRRSNMEAAQDAIHVGSLIAGESFLTLPACWLIKSVEALKDHHSGWYPLHRLHHRGSLRYAFKPSGGPLYYIEASDRDAPRTQPRRACDIEAPADAFEHRELITPESWSFLTLEIFPKASITTTIRVKGKFYSEPLLRDEDYNYWSINHPDTLLKAALYQLEIFYRNSEGAQDWLNSIQLDLTDLEQMEVLNSIEGKDEMGL